MGGGESVIITIIIAIIITITIIRTIISEEGVRDCPEMEDRRSGEGGDRSGEEEADIDNILSLGDRQALDKTERFWYAKIARTTAIGRGNFGRGHSIFL